jgi:hypothetical protein
MAKRPGSAVDPFWYKDAIIHELHVRGFKDSNRIGDFPGLNVDSIFGAMNDFRFFPAAVHGCTVQCPLARSSREGDACWR